ncbi:MAG: hypothetical protein HC869_22695 [Rhodospirillales bacterium]|nr:hypothetical protein [Rhodospirillales bacterium]
MSDSETTIALNCWRRAGFGSHFNSTDTPHRELVYRHLEGAGATIDRAEASDLLSSNTVEDIALIVAFTKARGIAEYCVITSRFHVRQMPLYR